MNASATSQFHSRGVSTDGVGSGFRFSSSYGLIYSRYRFAFVHRDRISVGRPAIGAPT
jgi:hypothetical protein